MREGALAFIRLYVVRWMLPGLLCCISEDGYRWNNTKLVGRW